MNDFSTNRDVSPYTNSVFEQPWWLDIVAPGEWQEIIVKKDGEVVGRLPFIYKKGNICMPPLTQTCGVWIKEFPQEKGNGDLASIKEIIYQLLEELPSFRNMKLALDSSNTYFLPYYWKGYTIVPHISYRIQNLSDIGHIYQNFGKTVVKNIKSANKKVSISREPRAEWLLEMLEMTFANQNRKSPINKDLVIKIIQETQKRKSGLMLTAKDSDGNIHASSYFIFDDKVFYYLLAGSNPAYRTSGAQSLILWEALQYAQGKSKAFDFEGSMVEGIENFMRRFGGEPNVYYEVCKETLFGEIMDLLKPRVKKLIKYKM